MESITHREMRNNSAEVLRRVENGESFTVTNNGRPVAVLGPAPHSVIDDLIAQGQATPARASIDSLRDLPRIRSTISTREIIADLRGDR